MRIRLCTGMQTEQTCSARTKCSIYKRAPMSRAACYCLARLPPTYKRNGIRRRPTTDYRPSGARQWDAPSAPTNDTTRASEFGGTRVIIWPHRTTTNVHNIRYNSVLRATIIVSWPIVIVIIFVWGIVSLRRKTSRSVYAMRETLILCLATCNEILRQKRKWMLRKKFDDEHQIDICLCFFIEDTCIRLSVVTRDRLQLLPS